MAIILKPRSNKQGVVDIIGDLANVEGRENYTVLVKDTGVFEWVPSGTVDGTNIIAAKFGYWSRVLQSGDGTNLLFTPENVANKSISVTADAASDTKYPSVKATKTYADSLVVGLLDDRGNFTPSVSSPGSWPTTGGSGTAGAIKKGDLWFCSANGFLGTTAVVTGASFRALVDSPGQTAANWNILDSGLGFTPENVANKSTSTSLGTSNTLYPTQNAVKTYVDNKVVLPYKIYTALLSASGTSLYIQELQNTIDPGNISYIGYGSGGDFYITSNAKFTLNKTAVFISTPSGDNHTDVIQARVGNENSTIIKAWRAGVLSSLPIASVAIEIRVYP